MPVLNNKNIEYFCRISISYRNLILKITLVKRFLLRMFYRHFLIEQKLKKMKKIEAIIRTSKFEEVKEALVEVGIDFFSYWAIRGVGKMRQERAYHGIVYDTSIINRTKLSIIVRDKNVDKTVRAIIMAARTGEIGDGKIFVTDIAEAYRIRTGEDGDDALFLKDEEE